MHVRITAMALLALSPGCGWAADLYLVNGKIFTGAGQPAAQALAIQGGKIAAVGENGAILAMARDKAAVIDLGGRLVTPGLIEAHGHAGSAAPTRQAVMPSCRTCHGPVRRPRRLSPPSRRRPARDRAG